MALQRMEAMKISVDVSARRDASYGTCSASISTAISTISMRASLSAGTIGAASRAERAENLHRIQVLGDPPFGMPLHCQRKAGGALHAIRFDQAVFGARLDSDPSDYRSMPWPCRELTMMSPRVAEDLREAVRRRQFAPGAPAHIVRPVACSSRRGDPSFRPPHARLDAGCRQARR